MITGAIIDSRESAAVKKMTFGGIPTMVMALGAGDLMASTDDGNQLLIERKTPEDLLGTLRAKRFLPQIEKMAGITPWVYVVITGILYRDRDGFVTIGGRGHTGWRFADVQGALLTAQEMGVSVVYCAEDDFEQTVIRLCNRDRGIVRVKPPRQSYLLTSGEAALAALPEIGPERVDTLMQEFGSVVEVLEWLTDLDNPRQIPGIASGIKLAVKKALSLDGERLLAVPQNVGPFFAMNGGYLAGDTEAREWIFGLVNALKAQKKGD